MTGALQTVILNSVFCCILIRKPDKYVYSSYKVYCDCATDWFLYIYLYSYNVWMHLQTFYQKCRPGSKINIQITETKRTETYRKQNLYQYVQYCQTHKAKSVSICPILSNTQGKICINMSNTVKHTRQNLYQYVQYCQTHKAKSVSICPILSNTQGKICINMSNTVKHTRQNLYQYVQYCQTHKAKSVSTCPILSNTQGKICINMSNTVKHTRQNLYQYVQYCQTHKAKSVSICPILSNTQGRFNKVSNLWLTPIYAKFKLI